MLEAFDAMPPIDAPGGATESLGTREGRAAVRAGWLKGGWKDAGLLPDGAAPADELRRRMGAFFSGKYRAIRAGAGA